MTDRRFIDQQNLNENGKLVKVDCRFCHILQSYDKYEHVAPCGCIGPNRYVHRQCLQRWATIKFEHVYNHPHSGQPQQFNVFCEVCQQRMEMEFELTNKCSKYSDFVQKIIQRKLLFSTLILLAVGLIIAIIIMGFYSSPSGEVAPKYIFGMSICSLLLLIVGFIFFWNFIIIKSIVINSITDNKNIKIFGQEANIDEVASGQTQQDPHFGVQQTKKDPEMDKSLMLQSKRDSAQVASSVVSKTLTDLVMMKMYKHDQLSLKGKSEREISLRSNRFTKYSKKEIAPQMKDQSIQISDLQKKNAQVQYTNVQKEDRSIQKTLNHFDQSIQKSQNAKHDISIQPSLIPSRKRIFKQDPSLLPQSSARQVKLSKAPIVDNKKFITQYQQKEIYYPREYERRQTKVIISSEGSKKSEEEMIEQQKPIKTSQKLKLKTSHEPIKIRVMF